MAAHALILLAVSAGASALPVPERVTFASLDADATAIDALYFPAEKPNAPLVIAAHGCGGMYSAAPGAHERLSERSLAWTEEFLADGYAVLWPDSFNPRGRGSVCLVKRGEPTITPLTRRLDILAAIAYAPKLRGVDAGRIALVGWSHGGSTTLATVNGKSVPAPPATLRAAVAFYPGCVASLRARDKWLPSPPLRVYIGALDDWSRPDACEKLGAAASARGADMTVTVYPGAYHGFDAPRGRTRVWKEVTTGVNAGNGVTLGPDPAARAAAQQSVRAFLRARLSEGKP